MTFETLFKKSKQLLDQVVLDNVKNDGTTISYFFKVKDYNVVLVLSKDSNEHSIWKRDFHCDCRHNVRGSDELCSHSIACLTWLVNHI